LIDAMAKRQGDFPDKGAAPGFAADKAHGFELGVYPRRRDQRQAFIYRQLPMGWQPRSGRQLTSSNLRGESVDNSFIASAGHRRCIHDNFLIVLILSLTLP
jgi:hypothetical protein